MGGWEYKKDDDVYLFGTERNGIGIIPKNGKYYTNIVVNGDLHFDGVYDTLEEAMKGSVKTFNERMGE